ncbi:MAG TPA: cupin domain-containing protein [Solirubrobacterales bacterium]|nr:cupin domain-containing protein [Solirubrobacterales bacterium]
MTSPYTKVNLTEVEDSAVKFGYGHIGEARFANDDLATEQTGISYHRLRPDARQAFGHRHDEAEEVYLVVSGAGQVKLDEEIVDVAALDAIRISPGVVHAVKAGPEGLDLLAVGPRRPDDRGELLLDWWAD